MVTGLRVAGLAAAERRRADAIRHFVTWRSVRTAAGLVKPRRAGRGAAVRPPVGAAGPALWHTGGMRQARFESAEVRDYVGARGGVLCISLQAIMHG